MAVEHGFPPDELADTLRRWLWTRPARREDTEDTKAARRARRQLAKDVAWAEEVGDAAGAEEARARRHPRTARVWHLEQHAARQHTPELAAQVRERAAAVAARPDPPEPSLTLALAALWLEHRGELPAPGGGDKAGAFVRFVDECAIAIGLHGEDTDWAPRWRDRWRREHMRIKERLNRVRLFHPL